MFITACLVLFLGFNQNNKEINECMVASEAYLNGRDLIKSIQCDFKVSAGIIPVLPNISAALLPNIDFTESCKCSWFTNDNYIKFCLISDEISVNTQKKSPIKGIGTIETLLPTSMNFIQDNSFQFTFAGNAAIVRDIQNRVPPPISLTPFTMGIMGHYESVNPAVRIKNAVKKGDSICRKFNPNSDILEVEIKEAGRGGNLNTITMYLNRSKNYLLERFDMMSGSAIVCKCIVVDSKQISGIWIPYRSFTYVKHPKGYVVREIQCTNVIVNQNVSNSTFSMLIPANTKINDGTALPSQLVNTTPLTVDQEKMPWLHARIQAAATDYSLRIIDGDAPLNPRSLFHWISWLGVFLICAVVALLAALVLYLRQKYSRSTA